MYSSTPYITSVERLAELGYPKELVDTKYLPDFAVRGLIFDKKQGNFLKLDLHGLVLTACRGIFLLFYIKLENEILYVRLPRTSLL